eukprot:4156336-Prymnesium_polylepis.1
MAEPDGAARGAHGLRLSGRRTRRSPAARRCRSSRCWRRAACPSLKWRRRSRRTSASGMRGDEGEADSA